MAVAPVKADGISPNQLNVYRLDTSRVDLVDITDIDIREQGVDILTIISEFATFGTGT